MTSKIQKIYTIPVLTIASALLFISCKSGEYKEEDGKLYHYHYLGIGVTKKKEVKGADLKTFQQITELYGKDKKSVYRKEELLPNADPNSFEVIDEKIYSKDKNNVYWYAERISNADPSSFQIIDIEYSKDKKHVFFKAETIQSANPETFERIYEYFSKDKENVFYNDKILSKADPATFEKITYSMWKDKQYVFYFDSILPNADPKTMKNVEKYDFWYMDKNAVYYMDNRIDEAPEDFEILDHCWGRSKTNYYCRHIVMPLDYATTEILTEEGDSTELTFYIKDKNNVFYGENKIEGADPKTFVVKRFGRFAYDANHEYDYGKIIK